MRIPLKITYNGEIADENMLPLYDGASSIYGFSQAIQIATHAMLTENIVSRATAARSADFFLLPSRRGSFIQDMIIIVNENPVVASITVPIAYDFLKTVISKASGIFNTRPSTRKIEKWIERDEPFFDALAETLEGSLQRAHRPVGEGVTTMQLGSPRIPLVVLNNRTKQWVNTREEGRQEHEYTGHITRFNSITRNGRVYIDQLERVLPFRPSEDFNVGSFQTVTWSLHGSANDLPKHVRITTRNVLSASDEIKRVILLSCDSAE